MLSLILVPIKSELCRNEVANLKHRHNSSKLFINPDDFQFPRRRSANRSVNNRDFLIDAIVALACRQECDLFFELISPKNIEVDNIYHEHPKDIPKS